MHVLQFQWSEFPPSMSVTNIFVWHLYYIFTQCSTIAVTSCSWLWWWIAMHFNSYSWFSLSSTHVNLHLATLISTVWTEIFISEDFRNLKNYVLFHFYYKSLWWIMVKYSNWVVNSISISGFPRCWMELVQGGMAVDWVLIKNENFLGHKHQTF